MLSLGFFSLRIFFLSSIKYIFFDILQCVIFTDHILCSFLINSIKKENSK